MTGDPEVDLAQADFTLLMNGGIVSESPTIQDLGLYFAVTSKSLARRTLRVSRFKTSPEAWARAREHFEQAIELDPDYAEPHAELGYYFFNLGFWGLRPPTEVMPLARAEARRALELSPNHLMAHIVLCVVAALYDCDWKEAEHQYRLGLALDPVPPIVRARLFYYLMPLGRFEEAVREIETALEQDPLNVPIRSLLSL